MLMGSRTSPCSHNKDNIFTQFRQGGYLLYDREFVPDTIGANYPEKIYIQQYLLIADPSSTTSNLAQLATSHPFWDVRRLDLVLWYCPPSIGFLIRRTLLAVKLTALHLYKGIKLSSNYVLSLHRLRHCGIAGLPSQSLPFVDILSFKSLFSECASNLHSLPCWLLVMLFLSTSLESPTMLSAWNHLVFSANATLP